MDENLWQQIQGIFWGFPGGVVSQPFRAVTTIQLLAKVPQLLGMFWTFSKRVATPILAHSLKWMIPIWMANIFLFTSIIIT